MGIRARQPENGQGVLFAHPVQRTEAEIRAEIEAALRARGVCFARTDASPVRVLIDGRPIFHGRVRRGWPDITAVLSGGRMWGIEVKRPGEKLNPEQEKVRAEIESAGGFYTVATSAADILAALEKERRDGHEGNATCNASG